MTEPPPAMSLTKRLELNAVMLSDGATGTYLQYKGLEPGG